MKGEYLLCRDVHDLGNKYERLISKALGVMRKKKEEKEKKGRGKVQMRT